MTRKQNIFISVAVFLLCSLLFFIIFSEHGLVDLSMLKKERDQLAEKSELLSRENLSLSAEIDRLQHDPKYIENAKELKNAQIKEIIRIAKNKVSDVRLY